MDRNLEEILEEFKTVNETLQDCVVRLAYLRGLITAMERAGK